MDNAQRSNYGAAAIQAGSPDFGQNGDGDTDLVDTLANLMHYARAKGFDIADAFERTTDHFTAECCASPSCTNDLDDGEGYDGFCGTCADKKEASCA